MATLRKAVSNVVMALSFIIATAAVPFALYWAVCFIYFFALKHSGSAKGIEKLLAAIFLKVSFFWLVASYAAVYVLPVIFLLPIVAPVVALWVGPHRFLLLRPFNRGQPNRALKRLARQDISGVGHVYTLADADIKVPWTARIPILLGQFSLLSFRRRKISTAAAATALPSVLANTWLRNLNWCLSYSKIFPVVSSDTVWHQCVTSLVRSVEAVLIDVTVLRANVLWEVEHCRAAGIEDRIIYLIAAEQREAVLADLSRVLGAPPNPSRIFMYDASGIADRSRFRQAIGQMARTAPTPGRLSVVATLLLCVGFYPLLPLIFYPDTKNSWFTNKWWFVQWSPWEGVWPRLTEVVNAPALAVFGFSVITLVMLVMASRSNRPLRCLVVVQLVLVLLSSFGFFPSAFQYTLHAMGF